jgi:hypothetical protein
MTQPAPADLPRLPVDDLSERLVGHPLYARVHDAASLRVFMRAHAFCVWDFQSLLKALQRGLTCVDVPWFPTADPTARRLINEIVLEEESDEDSDGGYISHYELYLRAMAAAGADTGPIEGFVAALRGGAPLEQALARPDLPPGVAQFVRTTLSIALAGEPHRLAAAFTYGREDVLPGIFQRLVEQLAERAPAQWSGFLDYLHRHIEYDGERHGPLSHALLARLCGDDRRLWREAQETARQAMEARVALWDALSAELTARAA